jgi:hypothetical protein
MGYADAPSLHRAAPSQPRAGQSRQASGALVTAQVSDSLTIAGRTIAAAEIIPLRSHDRIIEVADSDAQASLRCYRSTACWRGYVASWLLTEEALFLVGIVGRYRLLGHAPLRATWLNRALVLPLEDATTFSSFYTGPPFPERIRVTFKDGFVVASESLDWLQRV